MNDTREAVQHRLADVDAKAQAFLESVGDQLGVAGSPVERWARSGGWPSAINKFIREQTADLADDIEQLVYDDHRQFLAEIKAITGGMNR